MRVPEAHETTTGSPGVVVALIDLGYRHHPDLDGHLWENPRPTRGDVHGWDFMDDDATLEYTGANEDSPYLRNHHVFVAGEVAAVAPRCPIMILRVGYQRNHGSWAKAVRYAAEHGARVIVMPHGYIRRAPGGDVPLVYQGTDFSYPEDNPELRRALDEAYDRGCLVISGTADNLGRRVAAAPPAFATVCAVGSANRLDRPSTVAARADYVEFAAPAGQQTPDPRDQVWGCGGDENYTSFYGGCMASGFAGGVAALVRSRFPDLSNDQLRQVLRNTARPAQGVTPDARGWDDRLGYGLLDAHRAVSLAEEQLCRDVRLVEPTIKVISRGGKVVVEAEIENRRGLRRRPGDRGRLRRGPDPAGRARGHVRQAGGADDLATGPRRRPGARAAPPDDRAGTDPEGRHALVRDVLPGPARRREGASRPVGCPPMRPSGRGNLARRTMGLSKNDGPDVVLTDSNGRTRAIMGLMPNGCPVMALYDANGAWRVVLADIQAIREAMVKVLEEDRPCTVRQPRTTRSAPGTAKTARVNPNQSTQPPMKDRGAHLRSDSCFSLQQ